MHENDDSLEICLQENTPRHDRGGQDWQHEFLLKKLDQSIKGKFPGVISLAQGSLLIFGFHCQVRQQQQQSLAINSPRD